MMIHTMAIARSAVATTPHTGRTMATIHTATAMRRGLQSVSHPIARIRAMAGVLITVAMIIAGQVTAGATGATGIVGARGIVIVHNAAIDAIGTGAGGAGRRPTTIANPRLQMRVVVDRPASSAAERSFARRAE